MFRKTTAAAMVALIGAASLPMGAMADPGNGKGNGNRKGGPAYHQQVKGGCPPGLAKKHNGCTPPSLDRGHDRVYREVRRDDRDYVRVERYRVGDRFYPDRGDYVVINDPSRYGLDPRYRYYRDDNQLFRLNRDTMEIVGLMGLAAILSR